ncbi:MAG: hypothetical protein ACRD43_15585, partial [Pyrinomonadaceae bacterium]
PVASDIEVLAEQEFVPEEPRSIEPEASFAPEPVRPRPDLSFLDTLTVKLSPISSEDLEHVDDDWLDAAYERKLALGGDDSGPIENAAVLAAALTGSNPTGKAASTESANGSASTAAVRAFERPDLIPVFDDTPVELPELTENATEQELLAYAQNHPTVKKALRVFRGKIVEVKRRSK